MKAKSLLVVAALGVSAAGAAPPPIADLSGVVVLPPFVQPGEEITFGLLIGAGPGTWTVGGETATPAGPNTFRVRLPAGLRPSDPLLVEYVDKAGVKGLSAPAAEQVRVVPATAGTDGGPYSFDLCGPEQTAGLVCLCGQLPAEHPAAGLRVDGRPAGEPLAASRRSVCLGLPPGRHRIEAAEGSGFQPAKPLDVEALRITGTNTKDVKVGQPLAFRWTVEGTAEPVEIRVTNTTPATLWLKGNETQVIRSSGGSPNVAALEGKSLAPGSFHVAYAYPANSALERSDRALEMLTPLFQGEVKRIAQGLSHQVGELPADDTFEASRVVALLDAARDDLHRSLPYPELAAFRDAADARFAEARKEVEAGEGAALGRDGGVRLAAWRPAGEPAVKKVSKQRAEGILQRIAAWLSHLGDRGITRRIRFQSKPDGARFSMHPVSYPSFEVATGTNGSKCHVPLGLYRFTILKGARRIDDDLEVVGDEQEVFDCDFATSACKLAAGKAEDCP